MDSDVVVGVIYIPPGKSVDIFIEQLSLTPQSISGENKTLYLMGVFQYQFAELSTSPTNYWFLWHLVFLFINSTYYKA